MGIAELAAFMAGRLWVLVVWPVHGVRCHRSRILEQIGDEDRLVTAWAASSEAGGPAEAVALLAALCAEVALATLIAFVHRVRGELAPASEVGLEGVWLEGQLLAVPEPEGLHAMGV
jgi:hypothetical protein